MTSAWPMLGRTARMVRQKAEMMNSGADHAARDARDSLADGEVEDEAGGEQDGEQDESADVEFAAVGGLDGAGLGGGGVLRHGENPF